MQPEAPLVRVERSERRRAAHVGDPRARARSRPRPRRSRGRGRRGGRARARRRRGDAALGEARAHRGADAAARADDSDAARSSRGSSSVSGYRAAGEVAACDLSVPASRASSCARTAGQSSSVTLYQALSRFSPSRTSMCLRWIPSNVAPERLEGPARALVQRVGLELHAAAAPALEGVRELEQLRLDVGARAPGGGVQPRPADLDRAVLGPEREEPRRADDLPL